MNDQELKERLREVVETYAEKDPSGRRNFYACPFCGSGTHGHGSTGDLSLDPKTNFTTWKCFACGRGGDIGDFIAEIEGIPSAQGLARAREIVGGNMEPIKEKGYYGGRGLSDSTVQALGLGYVANKFGYQNALITFDGGGTLERATGNSDFKRVTGEITLFNGKDLYNPQAAPVFICEGWADAASVCELGGYAIAINGVENIKLVLEALGDRPTNSPLVIAFDNDKAGDKAAEKLTKELQALGYQPDRFTPKAKDVNEMLQANREELRELIREAEEKAGEGIKKNTLQAITKRLLKNIEGGRYIPVSSGLPALDEILHGGFITGTLVTIGGAPGCGKTVLAQVLADGIAKQGKQVLYACLEMSAEQMAARTLGREAYNADKLHAPTVTDILHGQAGNLGGVLDRIASYSENISYYETAQTIEDILLTAARIKRETGQAPYIFVDYIQILGDRDNRADTVTTIKNGLKALNTYAIHEGVNSFAVVADNRESAAEGKSGLFSGRDTSALEYTADYLLSLSFTDRVNKSGLTTEEIRNDPDRKQDVTLRLSKSRWGIEGRALRLFMLGAYGTFEVGKQTAQEPGKARKIPRV